MHLEILMIDLEWKESSKRLKVEVQVALEIFLACFLEEVEEIESLKGL